MSAIFIIDRQSELDDLHTWAGGHPADIHPNLRATLEDWLCGLFNTNHQDAYPLHIPVPQILIEPLDALIDDFTEVLAAHDEEFRSSLERSKCT